MDDSLLRNLDNDSVLLMYLADELPPADKVEVEQLLSSDASLRRALEQLRQLQENFLGVVGAVDRVQPLPVAATVAERQMARMIQQWRLQQLAAPQTVEKKKGLRYPWFVYPIATAASILIAFLVWWGNSSGQVSTQLGPVAPLGPQPSQVARNDNPAPGQQPQSSPSMASALFDDDSQTDQTLASAETDLQANAAADRDLIFPEDASGNH